jgi:hypothetical protein
MMSPTSGIGTFQTWRDVRLESVMQARTDISHLTGDADPADDLAHQIANQRDVLRKRRRLRPSSYAVS